MSPKPLAAFEGREWAGHRRGECLYAVGPEPENERMDLQLFCCEPVAKADPAGKGRRPIWRFCPDHCRAVYGRGWRA